MCLPFAFPCLDRVLLYIYISISTCVCVCISLYLCVCYLRFPVQIAYAMALRRAFTKTTSAALDAANDDRTEGDVYARQYYTAGRADSEVNLDLFTIHRTASD